MHHKVDWAAMAGVFNLGGLQPENHISLIELQTGEPNHD
jgi:hypothetical protein